MRCAKAIDKSKTTRAFRCSKRLLKNYTKGGLVMGKEEIGTLVNLQEFGRVVW
ncbi:MAG TPA: hypothetical protein PK811_01255 [bacterium]|jgi:hypothetical protein|nr:hypothetical protein [bacterium]